MKIILSAILFFQLVSPVCAYTLASVDSELSESIQGLKQSIKELDELNKQEQKMDRIVRTIGFTTLFLMGAWGFNQKSTYGYVTGSLYFYGSYKVCFGD